MNKNILIGIITVIVIILIWVSLTDNDTTPPLTDNTPSANSDVTMEGDKMGDRMMETEVEGDEKMVDDAPSTEPLVSGTYEEYAPEKVSSSGDTVLFFHANWCPSCRSADKALKAEMSDIPGDLAILKVNFDDSSDLRKKYGVTSQHTFVQIDADGNLVKKWSGSPTLDAVVNQLQ
jgi:thiol-disulfide isomerase/thioredoxin